MLKVEAKGCANWLEVKNERKMGVSQGDSKIFVLSK